MKKMWKEFKTFAYKGNVLDLAVGVIIGGAFGKIITSLVNDVVMPLLGLLMGGVDLSSLKWVLTSAVMEGDTIVMAENALYYGQFIQSIVDFFLIALSVFIMVRAINRLGDMRKKKEEQAAGNAKAPPAPTSEDLLAEIRDILKQEKS